MKRLNTFLGILLAAQLGLVLLLRSGSKDLSAFDSGGALLKLDPTQLSAISIEDANKATLKIVRKDSKWVLVDKENFPASEKKIKKFLDSISGLKRGWPVGRTKDAARQLRVAKSGFEKKIEFSLGEKEAKTLYLGSSPSFRKVHIRLDPERDIYAVAFNSYDANVDAKSWLDKDALKLAKSSIAKISLPSLSVSFDGKKATISNLPDGKEVVREKLDELVDKIASLSFYDLYGKTPPKEAKDGKSVFSFSIERTSGKKRTYDIWGPVDENYYVLKASDQPYYLKTLKLSIDAIRNAKVKDLVREKKVEKAKTESAETRTKPAVAAEKKETAVDATKAEDGKKKAGGTTTGESSNPKKPLVLENAASTAGTKGDKASATKAGSKTSDSASTK